MSKQFWRASTLTVVTVLTSLLLVVGQTLLVNATIPTEKVIAQVTSISQLGDVDPTHYYFQALQSLVERYGCVNGYPDKTIRSDRGLQAGEYIGFLNACLNRMNELIAAATADIPDTKNLGTMQKRLREIEADVSSIRR